MALVQTIATMIHLPGGWIMFTNVEKIQWRIEHQGKEIPWRQFTTNNTYLLSLSQVKLLTRFICHKEKLPALEIFWRETSDQAWQREVIDECD